MNERTIELMNEANKVVGFTGNVAELAKVQHLMDKFAELIVRECMSMCDETQANYLKHRKATIDFDEKNIFAEGEAASDVIKHKMKKHFGIEE